MSSQGDAGRRPRPVVTLIVLVILIIGAFLTCPALLDAGSAPEPAAASVVMAEAHHHGDHGSDSPACSPDAGVLDATHARLVDRSVPNPSLEAAAADHASAMIAWLEPPVLPSPRWCVPGTVQRSGRILLTDLVVARI